MPYFAWQRGPSGCIPVVFDEKPELGWSMAHGLVKDSLRELPSDLEAAPLSQIATWAIANLPIPTAGVAWYSEWGLPPTSIACPSIFAVGESVPEPIEWCWG